MLVIDASAVAELLLDRRLAAHVERHIVDHDHELHAPHLLDLEVLNTLRRIVARGDASTARATEAVADLLDLRIARHTHSGFTGRIWTLRQNFSPYDAAYVVLAEALRDHGASLLTADGRLARAARDHSEANVVLVE